MNKKILFLVIAIAIVAVAGVGIYAFTGRSENDNMQIGNSQTEESKEEGEDNNTSTEKQNILIVYFSQTGNTEAVANFIHEEVGGDLVKLETVEEYPSDYDTLVDYAQEEQREEARPELKTVIDDMDQYNVIFLGYPNWWGDMPMPIYTFLETYDFSGKTIAPFITHGGSGLSGTPAKIQAEAKGATVTEGLAVYGSEASHSKDEVLEWLDRIGF